MKKTAHWLLVGSGLLCNWAVHAGDYSGTYEGEAINMRVHKLSANAYEGSAQIGPQSCTFSADYHAEVGGLPPGYDAPILGTMRCGQEQSKFSANLHDNGAVLELHVANEFYALRRSATAVAPAPPGAQGKSPAGRTPASQFVLEQLLVSDGGNAYIGLVPGGTSARAGLQWVVPQIAGGFTADVVGDGALVDAMDAQAQLLFHTTNTKTPIRGLVLAQRLPNGVQVALVYQNVGKAAEGLDGALAAALRRFPQQEQKAEMFHETVFPDRSGSLMLPPGWQIVDSFQGAVNVSGPDGAFMDLGASRIILDPRLVPGNVVGEFVGEYCHPAKSLDIILPALTAMNARLGDPTTASMGRVIEYVDIQSPSPQVSGGRWALVDYEWKRNDQPYRSIALIGTVPMAVNWAHYSSTVSAPKHLFAGKLLTLMQIWQSYYVSDRSVAARLEGALKNLKEAGEIHANALAAASKGPERSAETWKRVLRDQTVVEGPDGWRYTTSLSGVDQFLLDNRDFHQVPVETIVGR